MQATCMNVIISIVKKKSNVYRRNLAEENLTMANIVVPIFF